MPLMTIDYHDWAGFGAERNCSVIIDTDNRFEVCQRIDEHISKHGKFDNHKLDLFHFLDQLTSSGLIKEYQMSVMRLTEDDIWKKDSISK